MQSCISNINSGRAFCSLHFLKGVSLLLVLLIPQIIFAQQFNNTITFKIDNFKRTLKITVFNGKEYFAFSNLLRTQIKHTDNQMEYFVAQCGGYQFSFIPGSIYFILDDLKQESQQILQISSPSIFLNGELWIPLKAFTNCLISLSSFEHSLVANSITLNTKREKTTKSLLEKKKYMAMPQTNRIKDYTISEPFDKGQQPTKPTPPLPRINLTSNERLSLEPRSYIPINNSNSYKTNSNSRKTNELPESKPPGDSTVNIPPKYYVLPPVLKNNPK